MAYVELLIAAVAAFALGAGWYTLFRNTWQAETGITDEQAQQNVLRTHGLAFLMMCIIGFGINYVVNLHAPEEQTFIHGAFHGGLAALLYGIPAITIHYLYQMKSLKLYLIDIGYAFLLFALMGGVLAALKLG